MCLSSTTKAVATHNASPGSQIMRRLQMLEYGRLQVIEAVLGKAKECD